MMIDYWEHGEMLSVTQVGSHTRLDAWVPECLGSRATTVSASGNYYAPCIT